MTPTTVLWLYAAAFGMASAFGPNEGGMPAAAELAASIALPLILCSWVLADARKRRWQLFHDFDSLVFFLWPVVVPVYLFQTRGGVGAMLTVLRFAGIWMLVAGIAFLIQWLGQ